MSARREPEGVRYIVAVLGGAFLGFLYVLVLPFVGIPVVLLVLGSRGSRKAVGALRGRGGREGGEPLPVAGLEPLFAAAGAEPPATEPVQSGDLLAPLVSTLGCEYVVVDQDLRITHHVSPDSGGLHGGGALVGKRCHEALHGSASPCGACGGDCPVESVLATGKPARAVHEHLVAGRAEPRRVLVTAWPVDAGDEAGPRRVALIISEA